MEKQNKTTTATVAKNTNVMTKTFNNCITGMWISHFTDKEMLPSTVFLNSLVIPCYFYIKPKSFFFFFLQGLNNFQILTLILASDIFFLFYFLDIFFLHKHLTSQIQQLPWTWKLHDLTTLKWFFSSLIFYFVSSRGLSSAKFFKTRSNPAIRPEKAK